MIFGGVPGDFLVQTPRSLFPGTASPLSAKAEAEPSTSTPRGVRGRQQCSKTTTESAPVLAEELPAAMLAAQCENGGRASTGGHASIPSQGHGQDASAADSPAAAARESMRRERPARSARTALRPLPLPRRGTPGETAGACAYYKDKEAQGTYIVEIEYRFIRKDKRQKAHHEPPCP